jgi:precorrin-6Y C5,15-methyltransferase (decarboxylating)
MILLRDYLPAAQGGRQLFGIGETEFRQREKGSLITKHEIRAISLAKMGLTCSSVIWDIGAGSWAVSIEASLLAAEGVVYAIEKNSADVAIIRHNIERFQRPNIVLIHGYAPSGLDKLPDPSAVFIGGSGGKLAPVLDCVCRRLAEGGRVVCNLATLENVNLAANRLKANGFTAEITLVNVARSRTIAGLTRFEPLNPVFVIAGSRSVENIGHKKKK